MKAFDHKSIVLIESKKYILSIDFSGKVLYHEHFHSRGFSNKELKQWKEIIEENRFSAYLLQVNNGNLLPSEDKIWLENLDLGMLYSSGIKMIAYVSPQNIFNSLEMEKEITKEAKMKIKIFKEYQDAVSWLQENQEKSGKNE